MQRATALFFATVCWVFCSLLLVGSAVAQDDLNCEDFDSREEAQAELERDPSDPHNLAADDDGLACETYPYDDGGDDNDTPADDQYDDGGGDDDGGVDDGDDVDDPDDVIDDTTSKKPLPDTGGVPLLGLAVGALAFVGVGFSVLRTSVRRNP
jgi:hypothetical protein